MKELDITTGYGSFDLRMVILDNGAKGWRATAKKRAQGPWELPSRVNKVPVICLDSCFRDTRLEGELDLGQIDMSECLTAADFLNHQKITRVKLTNYKSSKIERLSGAFWWCLQLIEVDLGGIEPSGDCNLVSMFSGCRQLQDIHWRNFNTHNVTKFAAMFQECENIDSGVVEHLDLSSALTLEGIFSGCSRLESIDLSNQRISAGANLCNMFHACERLKEVRLPELLDGKCYNGVDMFRRCSSLEKIVSHESSSKGSRNIGIHNVPDYSRYGMYPISNVFSVPSSSEMKWLDLRFLRYTTSTLFNASTVSIEDFFGYTPGDGHEMVIIHYGNIASSSGYQSISLEDNTSNADLETVVNRLKKVGDTRKILVEIQG